MHDFKLISTQNDIGSIISYSILIGAFTLLSLIGYLLIKVKSKPEQQENKKLGNLFLTMSGIGVVGLLITLPSGQNKIKTYEGVFKVTDASKSNTIDQNNNKTLTIADNHNNKQIINLPKNTKTHFKNGDHVKIKITPDKMKDSLFVKPEKPTITRSIDRYSDVTIKKTK